MNSNNKDWIWKRINHEIKYKNDYILSKCSSNSWSLFNSLTQQIIIFDKEKCIGSYLGMILIKNLCNSIFNEIIIYVNEDYPFKPPLVYLNNMEYVIYYKKSYDKYLDFIHTNNIPVICPCCDSITCNWSPSYKIWDIILEILRFEDIISKIYKYYLISLLNLDTLVINNIKQFVF